MEIEEHLADCDRCVSLARRVRRYLHYWNEFARPGPRGEQLPDKPEQIGWDRGNVIIRVIFGNALGSVAAMIVAIATMLLISPKAPKMNPNLTPSVSSASTPRATPPTRDEARSISIISIAQVAPVSADVPRARAIADATSDATDGTADPPQRQVKHGPVALTTPEKPKRPKLNVEYANRDLASGGMKQSQFHDSHLSFRLAQRLPSSLPDRRRQKWPNDRGQPQMIELCTMSWQLRAASDGFRCRVSTEA